MPLVELCDYDPDWPRLFQAEAQRLHGLVGRHVRSFEHVGSTAIPGLCAKSTIDIMGDAPTIKDAAACVPILEANGYHYSSGFEKVWPDRRFLHLQRGEHRVFQLHLVQRNGRFWNRYLNFRDALRADSAATEAYRRLKRQLQLEHPDDVAGYTDAKSPFIMKILERAPQTGQPRFRLK